MRQYGRRDSTPLNDRCLHSPKVSRRRRHGDVAIYRSGHEMVRWLRSMFATVEAGGRRVCRYSDTHCKEIG